MKTIKQRLEMWLCSLFERTLDCNYLEVTYFRGTFWVLLYYEVEFFPEGNRVTPIGFSVSLKEAIKDIIIKHTNK